MSMAETTTFEIPVGQFDLRLLPEQARTIGTEPFRDALAKLFHEELRHSAEWIQVGVDESRIRVSWRAKSGAPDPVERAIELLRSGDYAAGIRLLRLMRGIRPDDPVLLQNLGMALSDQGQMDEALEILRRAAQLDPGSANIKVGLAVAYSRKGDTTQALESLEAALRLEPGNPYALGNLAGCLLKLGRDLPRAERCFQQSLAALPSDQQNWLGLGQVLEAQGKSEESSTAYRRALDINAYNQLAEVAKQGLSRIAQRNVREAVGGGLRMDAVMYCTGALEKIASMSDAEVQKIAFEIASVAMNGVNPTDTKKRYQLKSLPGEFSGLQLLSYMYVTWKRFKPDADIGFDLSKEYAAALSMQKKS
jgi:tetratricopeptide (TPR) repeat protein